MKPQWESLSNKMEVHNKLIEEFTAQLGTDPKYSRALKALENNWVHVVQLHNDFDKLVEPIAKVEVKLPFDGDEFRDLWITYKEYLLEDHHQYFGSRREAIMLKRLSRLSGKDEKIACEMLELFISSGNRSIYKATSKQLSGEEIGTQEEPQKEAITETKEPKMK